MTIEVSIDFETRSLADIKLGSWRYAEDESTEALCLAYQHDEMEEPGLWLPGDPLPDVFKDKPLLRAWNAEFELAVWSKIMVRRHAWPRIKITQLRDTQAEALAMALPANLADAGTALRVAEEHLKDPEGKRLIQYLCKPYKGKLREDPERLQRLHQYCRRDVTAERAIARRVRRLDARELLLFHRNLQMNMRGMPVNMVLAGEMRQRHHELRKEAIATAKQLCGCSPTQVEQFREVVDLPNMQKKTVERAIADPETPDETKGLLRLRQVASSTSLAKLDRLPLIVCHDGTLKGLYKFHAASTGRWASQGGFNAQNMPRGDFETPEEYLEVLANVAGATVPQLVSVLRAVFQFPMSVVDYSQIETRMLLWLAGDEAGLDDFRQGLDPYKTMASALYRVHYDSVTKFQRQIGKSAVLGAGYQLGWRGYVAYADGMDIQVTQDEAVQIIDAFRTKYRRVVKAWKRCQNAAVKAIRSPGEVFVAARTQFVVKHKYLWLILPSGRRICYRRPRLRPGREDWMGPQIWFDGRDRYTKKWGPQSTYGGSLFQSITQGSARDVMADAMLRMWDDDLDVRGTVHDEIVSKGYVKDRMIEIMLQLPSWCADMPIAVDGWEGEFYRK